MQSSPTKLRAILLKRDQASRKIGVTPQVPPNGRIVNSSKFTARRAGSGESRFEARCTHQETGRHYSPSGVGGITPARSRRAAARRHGAYAPLAVATLTRRAFGM
jgi:hypothetical protein